MKNVRQCKVRLSVDHKEHHEYEAKIRVYTTVDALKRGALAYLASLVLIVICIPIPLVHFIAIPGLILMGPVLAFLVFRAFAGQEDLIVKGAQCPACKKPLKLVTTITLWPVRDRCPSCGESYLAEIIKGPDSK